MVALGRLLNVQEWSESKVMPHGDILARPARAGAPGIAHHGREKRASAYACRSFKRKNAGFWRAQFCTEVARPTRFEHVAFAFGEDWTLTTRLICISAQHLLYSA